MPKPNPALNSNSSKTSPSLPTTPTSSANTPIPGKRENWQEVTALVSGNGTYWMPLESIFKEQPRGLRPASSRYQAATELESQLWCQWSSTGRCQPMKTVWCWLLQIPGHNLQQKPCLRVIDGFGEA